MDEEEESKRPPFIKKSLRLCSFRKIMTRNKRAENVNSSRQNMYEKNIFQSWKPECCVASMLFQIFLIDALEHWKKNYKLTYKT